MKKLLTVILILSLLLSLCGCMPAAVPAESPLPTETPAPTLMPTPAPTPTPTPAPTPTPEPTPLPISSLSRLETELNGLISGRDDGDISVLVWDMDSEDRILVTNAAEESRFSASLIKLFVMLAAYRADSVDYFDVDDFSYSIDQMISVSSNDRMNLLVDELGGIDRVNELIEPFGFADTKLNKYLDKGRNDPDAAENVTSVTDCAKLLHAIYRGDLIDETASGKMLYFLLKQENREKIPAALPFGTKVAHKTGEYINEACHDAAIVCTGEGKSDYILCIMVNDMLWDDSLRLNVAISDVVWKYFDSEQNKSGNPTVKNADKIDISVNNPSVTGLVTDGSYTTAVKLDSEVSIITEDPAGMSALYLEWDSAPGYYTVVTDYESFSGGGEGYIHELLKFSKPVKTVKLLFDKSPKLCECSAYSAGVLPINVQDWQTLRESADILLFPTHADDEFVFFGGIIPTYAGEQGKKVQVVYLTNHTKTEPERNHELLNGLWYAGDVYYPVISNFPDIYTKSLDEARGMYDNEEVIAFQVEQIRKYKPQYIVGHDINGEYGHGVHMLNTWALMEAVQAAARGDTYMDSVKEYGSWNTPETWLHMYEENQVTLDWHVPLERFDGKTALDVAKEAYLFHESQQKWDFEVLEEGDGDCRLFGRWR